MVLNNFKNWFAVMLKNTYVTNGGTNYLGAGFNMSSTNTLFLANPFNSATNYLPASGTNYNYFTVLYGKGATAPTPEDYKLDDIITDGWHHMQLTSQVENNNEVIIIDTITNDSGEDITITELGINTKICVNAGSCLMYREVLSKPVILKPNDIYTFTIKLALA